MEAAHYVIRLMEQDDIPQVAQIDREAFPGEWVFRSQSAYRRDLGNSSVRYVVACKRGAMAEYRTQKTEKVSWFKRLFTHERAANVREDIVGFSGFWMMMREAHIIAIGVRDRCRRLGIGEGLLIATVELAQMCNANVVTLEVRASNEIAQRLYKKYGFQVTGRRPKYYSSNGEDAIIMSTDSIASMPFQASFQELRDDHARRHPELQLLIS
ncbi:MAG: ribosomal protein S18-alanine N-acetyltransferase [Dehalococcoidia bacterium]|nr:ribosomal protein S18-alanine N-acetyltransferase [Dehalococcoidia bacterium]